MGKRKARIQKQLDIAAAKKVRQVALKEKDIWAERQEAKNNNSESNATGKLISSLGESCINVENNQPLYKSASFYYDTEGGRIKVLGPNFQDKVFDVNSAYFPARLQKLLDWSIGASA